MLMVKNKEEIFRYMACFVQLAIPLINFSVE